MENVDVNGIVDKLLKSGIDCLLQRVPLVEKVYGMVEEERCRDVDWNDAG